MSDALIGQALALLSAFFFAFSVVCLARSPSKRGDGGVLFSVLVTAVFSALIWALTDIEIPASAPKAMWLGIVYFALAGVFAMILGRTLVFASIRSLGPIRASATKRLNPFFSVAAAALILHEPITKLGAFGMAVIAVGFFLLMSASLSKAAGEEVRPSSYLWGVGAAMAYAGAYITRKLGLIELPAPAFGTMLSAVTAIVFALVMACFSSQSRNNLRNLFSNLNGWVITAAISMSFGQIVLFAALLYERISVIVMIASLEVFIASFLSVLVFRMEKSPSLQIQAAAAISTLGVVLVAMS